MNEYHVLNLGAGVQSTTLYLMAMESGKPPIKSAIFADTQEEPVAVYHHLKWLQSLNGPPILVRTIGRLGDDLKSGRRPTGKAPFVSIPTFTIIEGGEPGRTKRQCSGEYKINVINKAIRREILKLKPGSRIPKNTMVHQYYGISLDEQGRASRIWERFHVTGESKFIPHFPLIDAMMTRANCLEWLKARVPHDVPRSACVFCPFHTDLEWQQLKDTKGPDWERAVDIDVALRTLIVNRDTRQTMYLHRSCQPLTQIEFQPHENVKELQLGIGFGLECEGVCGV